MNDKGEVVYYGITNRTATERLAEHTKTKGESFARMEVIAEGLSHDQARSLEGALIRQRLNDRSADWSDGDSIESRLNKLGFT